MPPPTSASYTFRVNGLEFPAGYEWLTQANVTFTRDKEGHFQTAVWKTSIPTLTVTPEPIVTVTATDTVGANLDAKVNESVTEVGIGISYLSDTTTESTADTSNTNQATSSITPTPGAAPVPSSPKSTPTPTTSSKSASNNRLPDGAVAGIAIATAIAGAALAAAVLFFLFFKRNRQRRDLSADMPSHHKQSGTGARGQPDGIIAGGLGKGTRASDLDYILPQPLDDGNIKAAVSDFFKRIEDHVDSRFYPDVPVSGEKGPTETSNELALLVVQPDLDVSVLLSDSHTRFQVLKALVCAETLASIDFEGGSAKSLLPKVVTGFLSKISPNLKDDHPTRLSLSRWRTSTRYLLGEQTGDDERARRDQVANAIVETLTPVLRRYAQPQLEDERRADLVRVCRKAEQLGLLLLAQPAEWMVDWEAETPKGTTGRDGRRKAPPTGQGMVVFPALIKVTDDAARLIQPRRVVVQQIRADSVR